VRCPRNRVNSRAWRADARDQSAHQALLERAPGSAPPPLHSPRPNAESQCSGFARKLPQLYQFLAIQPPLVQSKKSRKKGRNELFRGDEIVTLLDRARWRAPALPLSEIPNTNQLRPSPSSKHKRRVESERSSKFLYRPTTLCTNQSGRALLSPAAGSRSGIAPKVNSENVLNKLPFYTQGL